MKPRVLSVAETELLEAMLYYEERQSGLGADFYECVDNTMHTVGDDPLRFPIYEGANLRREYRRALVERFPYAVVFEAKPDEVVVVAIAHTSKNPGYWENS